MAKTEKAEPKALSEREIRWAAFLETYKAKNPAKYALKESKGEFGSIPDTF